MFSALTFILAAAAAQPVADTSTTAHKDTDPVICERQAEMGSRLRSRKICKHKSEWAEDRRSDRDNIERSQRIGFKGE